MEQLLAQMVATTLAAAGGGGHSSSIDWFVLGSVITNAVLFFGFLAYKLNPMVSESLKSRRENMGKQLEDARAKQAEAEKRLDEYKTKLENLEAEVARIVQSYEKEADADRQRMTEDTDRAIQRLARETEFTISQELKKAEKAIREAAVRSTLEAAEQILVDKISDDDRTRLADEYINDLEKVA